MTYLKNGATFRFRTFSRPIFWSLAIAVIVLCIGDSWMPAAAWAQQSGTGQVQGKSAAPVPQKTNPPLQVPLPQSGTAISGSYQQTINVSALGSPKPSTGERLNLSYAPRFGGSFDGRIEYYTDGSYNADPPGQLLRNINEPKFEFQVMYSRVIAGPVGFTIGGLQHENFRFPDHYFWGLAGLTYSKSLLPRLLFSGSGLVQAKLGAGRAFYDLSGTLEYDFQAVWNLQVNLHRYENLGQTDPVPTQKREIEFALNRSVGQSQTVGVSLFSHVQFGAPNDQFRFVKVKYGLSF